MIPVDYQEIKTRKIIGAIKRPNNQLPYDPHEHVNILNCHFATVGPILNLHLTFLNVIKHFHNICLKFITIIHLYLNQCRHMKFS